VGLWASAGAYAPALLLVLIGLGLGWWARTPQLASPAPAVAASSALPDYTLRRFDLQRWVGGGELSLSGEQLAHYPDRALSEIERMTLVLRPQGGRHCTAQALQGEVPDSADRLTLNGQAVVLCQPTDPSDGGPLRFEAQRLVIDTRTHRIQSLGHARITHDGLDLQAGTLVYDEARRVTDAPQGVRLTLAPHSGAR